MTTQEKERLENGFNSLRDYLRAKPDAQDLILFANYAENMIKALEEELVDAKTKTVKEGHWFKTSFGGSKFGCSNCGNQSDLSKQSKEYCSHCGTHMLFIKK